MIADPPMTQDPRPQWSEAQAADVQRFWEVYDAHYEAFAVDGDRAVALGWSRYWTDATRATIETTYDNVFLMRFDGDGRCTEFTELFMKRPDTAS